MVIPVRKRGEVGGFLESQSRDVSTAEYHSLKNYGGEGGPESPSSDIASISPERRAHNHEASSRRCQSTSGKDVATREWALGDPG